MGYALPTSRKYLAWYMQQQRKKRGEDSAPTAVKRFLTRLNPTLTQYFDIPSQTVDSIVMDVYSPTGVTTGLPTGATTPTANKFTTLNFVYSGAIDEIGRNGATYVPDGTYIANVKGYLLGATVFDYALDEYLSTTSVIIDSIGGNNGTAINIAESQLFTEVADGWEGVELVDLSTMSYPVGFSKIGETVVTDGAAGNSSSASSNVLNVGSIYKSREKYEGLGETRLRVGDVPLYIAGSYQQTRIVKATNSYYRAQVNIGADAVGIFSELSVKEFLEVAP